MVGASLRITLPKKIIVLVYFFSQKQLLELIVWESYLSGCHSSSVRIFPIAFLINFSLFSSGICALMMPIFWI